MSVAEELISGFGWALWVQIVHMSKGTQKNHNPLNPIMHKGTIGFILTSDDLHEMTGVSGYYNIIGPNFIGLKFWITWCPLCGLVSFIYLFWIRILLFVIYDQINKNL